MASELSRRERPLLRRIFLSSAEPRLRAGWRLLLQVLLQILLTIAAGVALLLLSAASGSGLDLNLTGPAQLAVAEVGELVTITLSVWVARRLLDHRSFQSLGLALGRRALLDVAAGIGITFAMMGMIFLAETALGWLTLDGYAWSAGSGVEVAGSVALFAILFGVVAWNEELMSRGYHLQTIASGLTLSWGLVISSAVFGVLHLGNPHATWVSAAGIFLAGLFLGYAYVRTRQLWLSIGLHIGWNFFEGVVFGFPVSGLTVFHLARISVSGPDLWTGGAFGPEAGLIVIPAIVLGTGLVHVYTRRRGVHAEAN